MNDVTEFVRKRPERVDYYIQELAKNMNKAFGTSYSARFWRINLGGYVNTMINRWDYLNENAITDQTYLLPINNFKNPTLRQKSFTYIRTWLISIRAFNNFSKIKDILKEKSKIVIGNRGDLIHKEIQGSALVPQLLPIPVFKANKNRRKQLYDTSKEVEDIFLINLICNVPKYYVEYFDYLLAEIPVIEPKSKEFHVEQGAGYFWHYIISIYLENGAKLYYYQPGGWIGETKYNVGYLNQVAIADKFYTYGWKISPVDEPKKSFRLAAFKTKYLATGNNAAKRYDALLCYSILNNASKERYATLTKELLDNIDRSKYNNLLLRPRGSSRYINNKRDLKFLNLKKTDKVEIDAAMRPMAEVMRDSQLVIHFDTPSTNFLECVYVDHPVVALHTNNQPTDIVLPYYDFFLEVKVFHVSWESLIEHINQVDLDKWWQTVIQSTMYQEYKNKFAR